MKHPINNRRHPRPPIFFTNPDNLGEMVGLAIIVLGPALYFFGFWMGWWG